MLDSARLERLVAIAGGKFNLTALIQKRMRDVILHSPRLGETDTHELFNTVLDEIETGNIELRLLEPAPEPKAPAPELPDGDD